MFSKLLSDWIRGVQRKNARQTDLGVEDITFLLSIPQSEPFSGTHGSCRQVHCQLSPGLRIHVGGPCSGHELCFGFSLHQARAEAFTDRNPSLTGENNWMLSWSDWEKYHPENLIPSQPCSPANNNRKSAFPSHYQQIFIVEDPTTEFLAKESESICTAVFFQLNCLLTLFCLP